MKEYTVEIDTTEGLDYLVMNEKPTDENVTELFILYKNDEAGESLRNARLLSWREIKED